MALLWNARNENEKKIMLANNHIKMDFLKNFLDTYFYDDFSLVEYVIAQDILKISEERILTIWDYLNKEYKSELEEIHFQLAKYTYPKEFNQKSFSDLTKEQKK